MLEKTIFYFAIFFTLTLDLHAKEFYLFDITNSIIKDFHRVVLQSGEEFYELQELAIDTYHNQLATERYSMAIPDLSTGYALVHDGTEILRVQSDNFDPHSGGLLKFKYLNNGITGKYKTHSVFLYLRGLQWVAYDENLRPIHSMHLTAKKFMGKVIGIEDIIINQPVKKIHSQFLYNDIAEIFHDLKQSRIPLVQQK